MARVSQAHLDARRRQILDAARRCFAANGFHSTSMQDVLKEAGLSAGAVYRYFPSKDHIIAAISLETMREVAGVFTGALDAEQPPTPEELVGRALRTVQRLDEEQEAARLVIFVWAEALRTPTVRELVTTGVVEVRGLLARMIAVWQERGMIGDAVPAQQLAQLMGSLLPGYIIQKTMMGDVSPESFAEGLGALLHSPART
ncbi:TetR/AcrR family transcriptional regulator [Allostreptomyces psammosilenae]|uniref:AcrR family transcriptional regulator n=1 Tax=Allostreptomyces psammosilenae TaxID=1892865 RepID=A0A853AAR3_9ACTN|nr:TetR/AcrR family transcriptional regulator [Allostreptomyces psammosilenae]NYI07711.1 AcrR family transcriptional regulator [Allostreptomyces psammosilenae]